MHGEGHLSEMNIPVTTRHTGVREGERESERQGVPCAAKQAACLLVEYIGRTRGTDIPTHTEKNVTQKSRGTGKREREREEARERRALVRVSVLLVKRLVI